ncbi:DUF1772 domain-containing protein [Rhizohabitans arisaemae]|uniref:anthrone oxygenase family protein n=1 Tax=Rhizohabitans arisaemae TaxID=2720610 RepID=UPI0024B0F66D|nr:anthrone oxygenase family protein [Rhizohabitans arisaemae]
MELLRNVTLIGATVSVGLIAGLLYGFACAVMPGLRMAGDQAFVEVMRRINVAIMNGWFAVAFAGAPILTLAAGLLQISADSRPALPWIGAGFVLYGAALLITAVVNVPLNNGLEADGRAVGTDPSTARTRFEPRWVRWNVIRTVLCTAAFACLCWALVLYGPA